MKPAQKMNDPVVYAIQQLGGRAYIGSTTNWPRRRREHERQLKSGVHHNRHLQRAWNKHGAAKFSFEVVERLAATTADEAALQAAEQRWIDAHRPQGVFNAAPALRTGASYTDEVRAAIRAARAKQVMPRATLERMWAANSGRARPPGVRAKIAAAHTGKVLSETTREKLRQAKLGRRDTAETRAKKAAAAKARAPRTAEHCAKLAAALTGKSLGAETIAKRQATRAKNDAARQITC